MDRKAHIEELLKNVYFADPMEYKFEVVSGEIALGGEISALYLQARYVENDTYTKEPSVQYTRKWHISDDATDSQIVQTAFKLCLTSCEHRCREAFQYKRVRVYGPHYDVEDLVKLGDGKGQWAGAPKADFKW